MKDKTVLIVEDSGMVAREISCIVEKMGHRVCGIVANGREAIEQAAALRPDLVLMDIVLADGVSGIDAARAIKAARDVPVIYLTARADEHTMGKALLADPLAYLVKPFKEQDLRAGIEIAFYKTRMEGLLREREQRYRLQFRNARDIMFSLNRELVVSDMSPSIERVLGIPAEEVIGRHLRDLSFLKVSDQLRIAEAVDSLVVDRPLPRIEVNATARDGATVVLEIAGQRIDLGGGQVTIAGIARDITERKKAEAELRSSEALANQILESSPHPQFIINADHMVINWNRALERYTGIPAREIIGTDQQWKAFYKTQRPCLADLLIEHCDQDIEKWYQGKYRKSELLEDTYEIDDFFPEMGRDGTWLSFTAKAIKGADGRIISAVETFTDISERHLVQERLVQLSQLKESLLGTDRLDEKLKRITDWVVGTLGADFARIWVVGAGDHCQQGCPHAAIADGPSACVDRNRCLQLRVSSGRYTHIAGGHARVPLGCYKIGRVASGEDAKFITNDVTGDVRVHDHEWAKSLGLVSFAGYRLLTKDGKPAGVLALFSRQPIGPAEDALLEDLASSTTQVLQTENSKAALLVSEERYRALFDRSTDSLFLVDFNGNLLDVNETTVRLTGYTRDELLTMNFLSMVGDEDRRYLQEAIAALATSGKSHGKREYGIKTKDGRELRMEGEGALVYHEGKPSAVLGVARDVTAQRLAENALRISENKFTTAFNKNPTLMAISTIDDGRIVDINQSFIDVLGYSREELLGRTTKELGLFQDYGQRETIVRAAQRQQRPGNREIAGRTKSGQIRYGLFSAEIIELHDGKYMLSVFNDITDRRQAEDALQRSEEKFNKAFANSPVCMAFTSLKDNRFVDVNQSFLRTFEYRSEDVIGKTTNEIGFYADMGQRGFILQTVREKGQIVNFEITAITGTGKLRRLVLSGQTVELKDGPHLLMIMNDITERKRSEMALRESEEQFRQLAENINQVYWLTDWVNGKLLYVNPNFEKIYGRSCQSAYENRLNWSEAIHPDDREWVMRQFSEKAKQGEYTEAEYRIIGGDGSIRWIFDRSVPIRDERGSVYRVASVAEDVTDRKLVEIALRESEERYKTMFTDTLEPMSIVSDGRLIDVNQAWLELHGYQDKSEVLGRDVIEFMHRDSHRTLQERRSTVYSSSAERVYQSQDVRKDGTSVYVEVKSSTIRLGGREVILAAVRDISERVEAERALQDRQQALQAIYEMATTPGDSFEKICQRTCLSLVRLIGVAHATVEWYKYDQPLATYRIDETGAITEENEGHDKIERTEPLRGGKPLMHAGDLREQFPDDVYVKSHPELRMYTIVPIMNAGGRVVGGVAVLDTAEKECGLNELHMIEIFAHYLGYELDRQRAEEELREAEKVKLLSNIAAGVAHEVRNPLHAIQAIVEVMFLELSEKPAYKDYLEHMKSQVKRLSDLMHDLLELGKPVQQINLKQEDAVEICNQAISFWCDSHPTLNRVINMPARSEALRYLIKAEGAKIQQVVINLLDNAYQHSPEHSEISINISSTLHDDVRISVTDQGCGIPEKNLQRLFEPFFTTNRKGTGLGLALCKHIIESHGGSISVSNNAPDKGCTVEIILPRE